MLWALGRMTVLFSSIATPAVAAILDTGFFVLVAAVAAREVLQSRNRNLPIVGLVLLFGIANLIDHLSAGGAIPDSELGWKVAIALVTLMISLIGGRIIPSFTRNWLAKRADGGTLPSQPDRFDLAVVRNAEGKRVEAAEALVTLMKRDRSWNDDGGRKKLLELFEAWGPKDPATIKGRRLLSAVLFS